MSLSPSKFEKVILHVEIVSKIVKSYSKLFKWPNSPNLKMVDIGTGPGQILMRVEPQLPKNYVEIIGVDKESEMVKYLNSIPKDSRISCRLMDIETTDLPEDLKERFDFGFSSYCFTFVQNCRQAFRNSRDMLKPNGELLFLWCKRAQLYEIYRTMNQTKKWACYTNDFKYWKSFLDNKDPIGTLEDEFNRIDLKILKAEILEDLTFEAENLQYFSEIFDSLDFVSNRIPKSDLAKYKEDFHKISLNYIYEDEKADGRNRAKFPFPTIVVGAKRA